MTDNTQPEALRLAEQYDYGDPVTHSNMWKVAVCNELRRQHARIAELESELEAIGAGGVSGPLVGQPQAMPDLTALTERGAKAWTGVDAQALREGRWYMVTHDGVATLCEDRRDAEKEAKDADMAWPHSGPHRAVQLVEASTAGFTAADMATAEARGFRDGVASLAASVGSELVYQARYQKWFWQDSSRECYEYLQNPENTCAEDWETRILYTHPPTAQAEGWRLVPVEPTQKMLFAAMNAFVAASASLGAFNAPDAAYRALLAAAPTHPTSSVVVEHG